MDLMSPVRIRPPTEIAPARQVRNIDVLVDNLDNQPPSSFLRFRSR